MHGDFSRWRHDPRYIAVLKQQGRVELDADANEQVAIQQYLCHTLTADVIGPCGAPLEEGGFEITATVEDDNPQLTISAGRIYVDGILCELHPPEIPIAEFLPDNEQQVRLTILPAGDPRFGEGKQVEVLIEGLPPQTVRIAEIVDREQGIVEFAEPLRLSLEDVALPPLPGELVPPPSPGRLPGRLPGVEPGGLRATEAAEREGINRVRLLTTYDTQPLYPLTEDARLNLPEETDEYMDLVSPPEEVVERTDLVYLDVWLRHVTAIEDNGLRDVALGGPDTTTRLQTVCQVKVKEDVTEEAANCTGPLPDRFTLPSGRLSTHVKEPSTPEDPCIVAPGGGYRGLENRLYRVEIHEGNLSGDNKPTFKWSRDNGSVVYPITDFKTKSQVEVDELGRDRVLALRNNDWVEALGDETELRGGHGTLAQVTVDEVRRLVTLSTDVSIHEAESNPKLRRWDGTGKQEITDEEVELEDGIRIRFSGETFRTGDYWFFAARTATREIEELRDAPPHGIRHHYCKLALLRWRRSFEGENWEVEVEDCRPRFPAANELTTLHLIGGDGQSGEPEEELCAPLEVRLTNGRYPVTGAAVRFLVETGNGRLIDALDSGNTGEDVTVETDVTGRAACWWELGPSSSCQRVRVFWTNQEKFPVFFNAQLLARKSVLSVEEVWLGPLEGEGSPLQNDAEVFFGDLAKGIYLACSGELDPRSVKHPTCFVTIEDPTLFQRIYDDDLPPGTGTVPMVLASTVGLKSNNIIVWRPADSTMELLRRVFGRARETPVLARLTVKGNFIWGKTDTGEIAYLDGGVLGVPDRNGAEAPDGRPAIRLDLPSGNGRPSDFEMWFWLIYSPPYGYGLGSLGIGTDQI